MGFVVVNGLLSCVQEKHTPFLAACNVGNIDVVKLLLSDSRVDVNKPDAVSSDTFVCDII